MGTQAPNKQRDIWVVAAVVFVVAGGAAAAYVAFSKRGGDNIGRIIAHLEQIVNTVEARRPETLRWGGAANGMPLFHRHTVRTAVLSGAHIVFASGRKWKMDEGTTVTLLELRGDGPEIELAVGVVRPEVTASSGNGAGSNSARVAVPDGRVFTMTAKNASAGGVLGKIVVAPNKPVVVQAADFPVDVRVDEAPMETGKSGATGPRGERAPPIGTGGFELKQREAVAVKQDGAKEELALPQRAEISKIEVVGEGSSRAIVIRLKGVEVGVKLRGEIARDPSFKEGRRVIPLSDLRIPISEPGRWYVRVVAVGRQQVESAPSMTRVVDVPAEPKPVSPGTPVVRPDVVKVADAGGAPRLDAGAVPGVDAGVANVLDAGVAKGRVSPPPVAPDEPTCARVKGGGSITKKSGAPRRGGCALAGDEVTVASGQADITVPGVGDVRLVAGGRMRIEKTGENTLNLSLNKGQAEIRSREHPVQVTGPLKMKLRPNSLAVTSAIPGKFVYVEVVSGRASVDMGSGPKEMRAGEAYQALPGFAARLMRPYREAGVVPRAGQSDYLASTARVTLRAEWKETNQRTVFSVDHDGKTVLQVPARKTRYAYDTHGYGKYVLKVKTQSGETVFEESVTVRRDPWEKIEPTTKTMPVKGIVREAEVGYDTLLPNLRFTWEPIPGAKKYYFSLATDAKFKKRVLDEEVVTPIITVPSSRFKENTRYYWRVVAGGGSVDDTRGPFALTLRFKSSSPSLQIQTPKSNTKIRGRAFTTSGVAIPKSKLKINGVAVDVDESGRWSKALTLSRGENWVVYVAIDPAGRTQRFVRRVDVE
ncbi:MAG: hypothetical protein HYY84_06015 [Deltaproteobacteria bacterium]|nr:hypothetical protein [Deltaproteobacteria bacterium]